MVLVNALQRCEAAAIPTRQRQQQQQMVLHISQCCENAAAECQSGD
jgi:hypothetical protein